MNTAAGKAVRNVKGMNDRSVSGTQSLLHENSNFMSMDKKTSIQSDPHGAGHGGGADRGANMASMKTGGDMGMVRQTLFQRITGGKSGMMTAGGSNGFAGKT